MNGFVSEEDSGWRNLRRGELTFKSLITRLLGLPRKCADVCYTPTLSEPSSGNCRPGSGVDAEMHGLESDEGSFRFPKSLGETRRQVRIL